MQSTNFEKSLKVLVPESMYQNIKEICDERGMTMSDWIRDAIDDGITENLNSLKRREL